MYINNYSLLVVIIDIIDINIDIDIIITVINVCVNDE